MGAALSGCNFFFSILLQKKGNGTQVWALLQERTCSGVHSSRSELCSVFQGKNMLRVEIDPLMQKLLLCGSTCLPSCQEFLVGYLWWGKVYNKLYDKGQLWPANPHWWWVWMGTGFKDFSKKYLQVLLCRKSSSCNLRQSSGKYSSKWSWNAAQTVNKSAL